MKIIAIMLILFIPLTALAHDAVRDSYRNVAWDMYQATRICSESYSGSTHEKYVQFEQCLKVQNTCYGIYQGMSDDKNRDWMTHSEEVKKYTTEQGLAPYDYCHILRIMSEVQKKPKGE